jgi:hypothetical protein
VAYLVKFPMASGESVVVEMGDEQLAGFAPAAVDPGEVAATATESFESAVEWLLPAVRAIGEHQDPEQTLPEEVTAA